MQKIMFNDRYDLTQAVIDGRKTITRRIVGLKYLNKWREIMSYAFNNCELIRENERYYYRLTAQRYKVGEVVAVAQSYEQIASDHPDVDSFLWQLSETHGCNVEEVSDLPSWHNKMYVRADLMPHRIRITNIRCERLQNISNEDCVSEGLRYEYRNMGFGNCSGEFRYGFHWEDSRGRRKEYFSSDPRDAFAMFIDKMLGRGTWERNPWVMVYEFKLENRTI